MARKEHDEIEEKAGREEDFPPRRIELKHTPDLDPLFRGMGNEMEDVMKLEGYLMKEKSKLSVLHGLTGDVNKRYLRIRRIEVGA